MTLAKISCNLCQRTIRKDVTPIICKFCSAYFHKKCAKMTNSEKALPTNFTCSTCKIILPKPSNDNTHTCFNAKNLNSIFNDNNHQDNNSHDGLNDPLDYNFSEQYLEINSTQPIVLDSNNFFIISINIRSIVNSLNFSKLEAFVCNLKPQPNLIAVSET